MAVQSGVYRGVSAADRAAARRRRLLEATLEVWADPGSPTTMTAVCRAAGLSERYFYESFPSLDDARTAVLEDVAREIETATLSAADAAGSDSGTGGTGGTGDPAARIRAAAEAFVALLVADPRKGRVAIIEAGADPALRGRRTALLRHFAHLSAVEAQDHPARPDRTDEQRAGDRAGELAGLLFIGGMAELVTAWLDGVVDATPEEVAETASRGFLGLLG